MQVFNLCFSVCFSVCFSFYFSLFFFVLPSVFSSDTVFETYCGGVDDLRTRVLFQDLASKDQIRYTNASTMVHDFKLCNSRAKVEHFLKCKKQSTQRWKPLPKGTFCNYVWIDSDTNTVPRLTRTGSLPVTPIEMKERFIHRTRHVMQWRKLDTAGGLTSIASLALFIIDIANIACSRMEGKKMKKIV